MFSDRKRHVPLLFPFTFSFCDWLCFIFEFNLGHNCIWPWIVITSAVLSVPNHRLLSLPYNCKNTLFTKALISCRDMLLLLYVGLKMSEISAWTKPSLPSMPYILAQRGTGKAFSCIFLLSLQSQCCDAMLCLDGIFCVLQMTMCVTLLCFCSKMSGTCLREIVMRCQGEFEMCV